MVFNEFKKTGPSNRFRGLRVNNRNTKGGLLNSVGTFALVNGAKAAHISTLHIKADGAVITDDDMFQGAVTKVATGEYELNNQTQTYPDWVHVTPYVTYSTGATTPRFAVCSK